MNIDRIKEIQNSTSYPDSKSVQSALSQVWNEVAQEYEEQIDTRGALEIWKHIQDMDNNA